MTTQADFIKALGGYHSFGPEIAKLAGEADTPEIQKKWAERARKWQENNHIPPRWRMFAILLGQRAGAILPAALKLPEGLRTPEEDKTANGPADPGETARIVNG
jgi:hypothetical protein